MIRNYSIAILCGMRDETLHFIHHHLSLSHLQETMESMSTRYDNVKNMIPSRYKKSHDNAYLRLTLTASIRSSPEVKHTAMIIVMNEQDE